MCAPEIISQKLHFITLSSQKINIFKFAKMLKSSRKHLVIPALAMSRLPDWHKLRKKGTNIKSVDRNFELGLISEQYRNNKKKTENRDSILEKRCFPHEEAELWACGA